MWSRYVSGASWYKSLSFSKETARQARTQSSASIRAVNKHFVQCNHRFILNKAIKKWITHKYYFQYTSSEILSQWTNIKAKCNNWVLFQPSLFEVVTFTKRTSDSRSPSLGPIPTAWSVQRDEEKYSSLLWLQFQTEGTAPVWFQSITNPLRSWGFIAIKYNFVSVCNLAWHTWSTTKERELRKQIAAS